MFTVQNLTKSYGLKPVLVKITFGLKAGERAALVGPNGCGKSTLLNIIAGVDQPDLGHVAFTPADLRVGYLQQGLAFSSDETVGRYLNRFASNLDETLNSLAKICEGLAENPQSAERMAQYAATLKALERAQELEGTRLAVLSAFQLEEIPYETPIASLSRGQKVRLALAGILLDVPQVLLLDEPTNHLDLEMRTWLRDWILSYPGAVLLVSHDRAFLDAVIYKVVAFQQSGKGVREYPGNYSNYLEAREAENTAAMQAYVDQQDEIRRLKRAARSVRDQAKPHKGGKADGENTDGFSAGHFSDRSLKTVRRAKELEKRIDFLEGEGKLEKPSQVWEMRMHFADTPEGGQIVLQLEHLEIGYEGIPLLPPISQTVTLGQRIGLVGPNGVGKTTLFKTLLGEIEPVSGAYFLGSGIRPGYLSQDQEVLNPKQTVLESIQKVPGMGNHTEARTFLHRFLFKGDEVFQRMDTLSFGQRSRMMLAMLVAQQCNLLLLDEPLNHLDIASRNAFEAALGAFPGTILAIAHDQYFIDQFAQVIWQFSLDGFSTALTLQQISTIYDDKSLDEMGKNCG